MSSAAITSISSLIGSEAAFPVLHHFDFFNHAGIAPLPRVAAEALCAFADHAHKAAYLEATWFADIERLRASVARLLNAHRDEIAFVKNTSEGISIVANGIDWQFGDRIVTTAVEYPANIYPWMEVARSRGTKLVMVHESTDAHGRRAVPIEMLLAEIDNPKTKLVTLSHVEFASGQRHDLARIGALCKERRILFCVDAIQSLGALPVDVRAMNIDYLAADGHKWLLGPEGAGVFFCRRELIARTRPLMVGWMNVIDATHSSDYNYTLRDDAARFECGSHNVAGLLALRASVELLQSTDPLAIAARLKQLGERLIAGLTAKGYGVVSPREGEAWSGIISFTSKTHSHQDLLAMLRTKHRIELALREGRLRCSPHFYNTDQQMDRLIAALPAH